MQQQALDLPVEVLSAADTDMTASLSALRTAAPEVFAYLPKSNIDIADVTPSAPTPVFSASVFSQSEHRRTFVFGDYLLNAIYDLVVISTEPASRSGQIFDWKTHQKPPSKERLATDWQKRLYPYILCETSDLSPEEISITYWFVRPDRQTSPVESQKIETSSQPSFYKFSYDLAQHDQTRKDLRELTERLTTMREQAYFPKVAVEKGLCDRCPFNLRCDRPSANTTRAQNPQHLLKAARQLTADSVPEIPL